MKKRIVIADISSIKINDNNFGHYGKTAQMYRNMLKKDKCVVIAGGPIYSQKDNVEILPFDNTIESMDGALGKIKFKLKCIINGISLFSKCRGDVIICQPYSFVSWMISILFASKNSSIYLIEYKNELTTRINNLLFKIAKWKINGVICPNEIVGKSYGLPYLCVSDYIYDKEELPCFNTNCDYDFGVFGIMSSGKDVKHVIRTFANTKYKVLIAGYCGGRYEEFMQMSAPNITIVDKYLSDEEYSEAIRRTKVVILPYKDNYKNQSSGVIFDVLFRGKPVLTRNYDNFKFVMSNHIGELYDYVLTDIDLEKMIDQAQAAEFYENIKDFILDNKGQIDKLEAFVGK